jgi:putative transposase
MNANTYCGDIDRLTSAGFTIRFDPTMARLARAVVPGAPHHVLQRGNPGQRIFSTDQDYKDYLELVAEGCENAKVKILAYCLLPKQVQLILVPTSANALRQALGEAHRRFTRAVNLRRSREGGLFRGRFASFPMDKDSLAICARYVETAPARGKPAVKAKDWRWSSASAHLKGKSDGVVDVKPVLDEVKDWKTALATPFTPAELKAIAASEHTGRPFGSPTFVKSLEKKLGRTLARQRPGPKPAVAKPVKAAKAKRK